MAGRAAQARQTLGNPPPPSAERGRPCHMAAAGGWQPAEPPVPRHRLSQPVVPSSRGPSEVSLRALQPGRASHARLDVTGLSAAGSIARVLGGPGGGRLNWGHAKPTSPVPETKSGCCERLSFIRPTESHVPSSDRGSLGRCRQSFRAARCLCGMLVHVVAVAPPRLACAAGRR